MTKHLYIHIPFCNQICSFCDFKRIKTTDNLLISRFIDNVIEEIKISSKFNQYTSIYLGGGTPNYLDDYNLNKLLNFLVKYLDTDHEYEFCIECNPDLLTKNQAIIFSNNQINRVSIGVQVLNNKLLKQLNRKHNVNDVISAINNLRNVNITNINLDFIYNLPNLSFKDIDNIFIFINKYKINHVSFYSLELKPQSLLNKIGYKINQITEENQLDYIKSKFYEQNYYRYEISNWTTNKKYESIHNKAYWLTQDWKAIGYGGCGFENLISYRVEHKILNPSIKFEKITLKDYYFQILMMGLRLYEGINISVSPYKDAYLFYKDKLCGCSIKNNMLYCDNIDTLNDVLIPLL